MTQIGTRTPRTPPPLFKRRSGREWTGSAALLAPLALRPVALTSTEATRGAGYCVERRRGRDRREAGDRADCEVEPTADQRNKRQDGDEIGSILQGQRSTVALSSHRTTTPVDFLWTATSGGRAAQVRPFPDPCRHSQVCSCSINRRIAARVHGHRLRQRRPRAHDGLACAANVPAPRRQDRQARGSARQ